MCLIICVTFWSRRIPMRVFFTIYLLEEDNTGLTNSMVNRVVVRCGKISVR